MKDAAKCDIRLFSSPFLRQITCPYEKKNEFLDPSFQVLDPSFQVLDPPFQVWDPSFQVWDPPIQVWDPPFQVSESVQI